MPADIDYATGWFGRLRFGVAAIGLSGSVWLKPTGNLARQMVTDFAGVFGICGCA